MQPVTEDSVTQGDIIDRVKTMFKDDTLSKVIKENIENGICFALCVEWFRSVGKNGVEATGTYHSKQFVDNNISYFKQIAMNFFHYIIKYGVRITNDEEGRVIADMVNKLAASTVVRDSITGLERVEPVRLDSYFDFYKWYTDLCTKGALVAESWYGYSTADEIREGFVNEYNSRPGMYYVGVSDHQMAFVYDESGKFWFYDPNLSVCRADSIDKIVKYLDKNYDYSNIFDICRVVRKQP